MRGRHFAALLAAAFLYPIADSYAASVFRCVGADGHVTFTRHGCSDDQEQHLQDARNHTPSSGKAIPLADPDRRTATASASSGELVIVGQQDDGCGNLLSSSERRQAIIRKEVRRGMSRADVESTSGQAGQSHKQQWTAALSLPRETQRREQSAGQLRRSRVRERQMTHKEKGPALLQALSVWRTQEDSNLRPLGS
ncbi:DUF4124 domain-containing protein [Ectopseudomonas composti]|uniref:DUF4124 domain-containing protein n=1 Tax=Ectopseudomonas composti TaxID=658457 RepID=UPI001FC93A4B|nr:DUF4124 domain-containing protein [Pseudomonas composti]